MTLEAFSLDTVEAIAQEYGYWAVFLGILLENLGLPLPGETITLAGGFLAGNGDLRYSFVLADAALGAIIGGNVGYWVGRWGGWPLLHRVGRLFRVEEARLQQLRTQFSNNAAKAVFAGRFVALLRVFASPLAGLAHMPYWQFTIYNTAGAVLWATTMVSLAFFAGQLLPLEQVVALTGRFAVVTLLVVAAWLVIPFWLESRKPKETAIATESDPE